MAVLQPFIAIFWPSPLYLSQNRDSDSHSVNLFFSDETMSYEAYNWRGLVDKTNHSKVIHCTNTQEPTGIYINIEGSKEEILQANTGKSSGRFRFVVYD